MAMYDVGPETGPRPRGGWANLQCLNALRDGCWWCGGRESNECGGVQGPATRTGPGGVVEGDNASLGRTQASERQTASESSRMRVWRCVSPSVRVTLTPFPPHSRLHHNHWTLVPRPAAKEGRSCPILREAVRIRRVPRITRGPAMAFCRTPQEGPGCLDCRCDMPSYLCARQTTRNTPPVAARCYGREEAFRGVTFTMGSLINEERDPRGSVTELGRT